MTTALIILSYLLIFTTLTLAFKWSECKGLKKLLDDAHADRREAWDEVSKVRAEWIADTHRATDRINRMTNTVRSAVNNVSKEH